MKASDLCKGILKAEEERQRKLAEERNRARWKAFDEVMKRAYIEPMRKHLEQSSILLEAFKKNR